MKSFCKWIIISLPVFFSMQLLSQHLTMEEMISMRKLPITQIDSILKSKDFTKTKEETDSAATLIKYTSLTRTDTSLIQRTFTIEQKNSNFTELQYGVYQKEDAQILIDWLEKNGFKKTKTSMPANDGDIIFEYTAFQKKNQSVEFKEKEFDSADKKEKLFIFTVNTFDYP